MRFPACLAWLTQLPRLHLLTGVASLALVGAVYLNFGTLPNATRLIRETGYYACLLLFVLWLVFAWRSRALQPARLLGRDFWITHALGLGVAAAAIAAILLHEPWVMRVFYDEPAHQAVAMLMHEQRLAANPSRAHYQLGHLYFLDYNAGFRTVFYPFLVSLLHDLTGYRLTNGFIVNGLLTGAFIVQLYVIGLRLGHRLIGVCLMLLAASLPLLAATATSAGYDLANLCFLSTFLLAGWRYIEEQTDARLSFWVLTGLVLAMSRNESVLYLGLIPMVAVGLAMRRNSLHLTWTSVLAPLCLLYSLAHKVILSATPEAIPAVLREQGISFFTAKYIPINLELVTPYLFSFDIKTSNSTLLSILGMLGLLFLLVRSGRNLAQRSISTQDAYLLVFALFGIGLFILILSHFWRTTESQAIRLLLPFHFHLMLASGWLLAQVRFPDSKGLRIIAGGIAGYVFLCTLPATARSTLTDESPVSTNIAWFLEYIQKHDDGRSLYISQSPLGTLVYHLPSAGIIQANAEPENLCKVIKENLYQEIIFFEVLMVDPKTGNLTPPSPGIPLSPKILVDEVAVLRKFSTIIGRITRFRGYVDAKGKEVLLKDYVLERPEFKTEVEFYEYLGSILP